MKKNVGLANWRVNFICKQQHTMFMKQQTLGLILRAVEVVKNKTENRLLHTQLVTIRP